MKKFSFPILFLAASLWATQGSAQTVTAKPWEKLLGSWKEIPGPDAPALIKVEPEGSHIKFSFGCKQDGSCPDIVVVEEDGKPYKDAVDANWEMSYRKTGERAMKEEVYLNGELNGTVTWQLSLDGNTLTRTDHFVSSPGSKDRKFTHDRSGGPVSKEDPFIGFWKYNWNKSDPTILTYTAKGELFTFTAPNGVTSERNCDGKDHPLEILGSGWAYSCQFIDEHTYEMTEKQNGKVLLVITRKVSADGKTMVATVKNAEGKITSTTNLEKVN
jgi:hypothetical protein